MNRKEINVAIAQVMGLEYHKPTEAEIASGSYYQYEPDFTTDLNAMAAAKKTLSPRQRDAYAGFLGALTGGKQIDYGATRINVTTEILFVTSEQEAEAFLRAIGKWDDSK